LDFVVQLPQAAVPDIVQEFSRGFYIEEAAVRAVQEMLRRRARVTLFGEPAWISTAEDVILHKLVWNCISPSDRQLADAAGIVAVQADALDKNYLRRWAHELKVAGDLERLLSGEIKPKNT